MARNNSYGPGFAVDAISQRRIGQNLNYSLTDGGVLLPTSSVNALPTQAVGPALDAAGQFRVSNRTPLFANKNLDSKNNFKFQERDSGGAETITFNYDTASADLNIGTASGEFIVRQSIQYLPYDPGNGDITSLTYIPPTTKANQVLEIGRGDDNDGLFMGRDETGIYFFIRTSTSGSPVDGAPIRPASWNGDKLDGTGPSGITLDPDAKQFFFVDFLWQGVGDVRFGFKIGGKTIICHTVTNANVGPGLPFIRTPTLPVRYKIYNTGIVASVSTLKEICSDVESEGGHVPPGNKFSVAHLITARRAVTVRTLVFAMRLKNTFNGELNRGTFKLSDVGFSTVTNDAMFELAHIHGVTADNGTWIDFNASSRMEFSRDISSVTAAATHIIDHQFEGTSVGNKATSEVLPVDTLDEHSTLSQNFESDSSQIFGIYATAEAGTANVWVHGTGREYI